MNNLRTIYKMSNGKKIKVQMKDLYPGDLFSMDESDGSAVVWKGTSIFKAIDNPTKNCKGIWGVNADPYKGV